MVNILISEMENKISNVINGENKQCNISLMPISYMLDYLKSIGAIIGEMNTNGWQVDYWVDVNVRETKYKLSGCMYYGNAKFKVVEED